MGNRSVFDKGKAYGLEPPEVRILFKVAAWFNGFRFTVHDRKRSIASAHEPPLRQLFDDRWDPQFDEAHERLIQRGLFKSQDRDENVYIAGRRCRYAPTQNCLKIIEQLLQRPREALPRLGRRRTHSSSNVQRWERVTATPEGCPRFKTPLR